MHLSTIKVAQSYAYPHVSFISPWKQNGAEDEIKHSLVLGHLQNLKLWIETITLEIANKDDKLNGYIYFSNDYELLPLKRYLFKF